jgi:hypothetical protein
MAEMLTIGMVIDSRVMLDEQPTTRTAFLHFIDRPDMDGSQVLVDTEGLVAAGIMEAHRKSPVMLSVEVNADANLPEHLDPVYIDESGVTAITVIRRLHDDVQ